MPAGENMRENHRESYTSVLDVLRRRGYDVGAPWECLHVSYVPDGTLRDSDGRPALGLFSYHTFICDRIQYEVGQLDRDTVEHEMMHFILRNSGIDNSNHEGDFPEWKDVLREAFKRRSE